MIVTTVIVSGQAQTLIASALKFAQAQGLIKVEHILKSMTLGDRVSLTMDLTDRLIQSTLNDSSLDMIESDTQIQIDTINRSISIDSNDRAF